MSTISSLSSTTNPHQTSNQNGLTQVLQDFSSIGSALQSGNVSSAQNALSAFQQDLQGNSQTSANQPFGKNSQANTDFQNLVSALKTGDLSSAQKAFSSLQTELKATHKGHHHHGSKGATSATTTTSATPTTTPANTVTPSTGVDRDGDNDGSNLNVTA